jgi:hypothetical protein
MESAWMVLSDGQFFHRQPEERIDGWLSECLAVFQPSNNEGPASQIGQSLRYHYARLPSHSTLHNQTNLGVLPLSAILPEHPG